MEAADVTDRALAELGDRDQALTARLEAELAVAGMHDARRASRVAPVIARLTARSSSPDTAEALAVARGMASLLTGQPSAAVAGALDDALLAAAPAATNWDTRAALLWTLITAERFQPVEAALPAMIEAATRSGSARGLIAVYSSLGFAKLRLGALPEADGAARIALRVLQEGDFTAGLGVAGIAAEVAVEAGELDEAQALLALVPAGPAGVLSVLAPAAMGRLSLARGDGQQALSCFESCLAMFGSDCGASRSATSGTCTPGPAPLRRGCCSATATAPAPWPSPNSLTPACSAAGGRSGSRCAWPAWPSQERKACGG